MIDNGLRNMFGLRDTEKRIYQINTDEVSAEEYAYCQVLHNVLWGEKGLTETLGPTWNMVHDSRFENLERKFVVNRPAVFGGDARVGKQYIDGEGLMSHSMAELEAYSEILGEGRHFAEVVRKGDTDPREFYAQPEAIIWKCIKQECPNYFDDKTGLPNTRALRLLELIKGDLLGLIEDYAEVAFLQDWIKVNSGEQAQKADFLNVEDEPIVYAEVDYLERALSMRSSLRVSAVKVLQRSGLLKLLETSYELTDQEIDEILKLVYQTPYEKLYEVPAKVIQYANQCVQSNPDTTKRMLQQCHIKSKESKIFVSRIKTGDITPLNISDEVNVDRELTPEEQQIIAIQNNPWRRELFLLLVESEKNGDTFTQNLIQPIIENVELEVDEALVSKIRTKTRNNRVSSVVKGIIS
ncbi:MAG: hypothetical protein WCQ50_19110 [Spirochaetota bacterium]